MGYYELGRAVLTSQEKQLMAKSIIANVEVAPPSAAAACFEPRHGLVLGNFQAIICFECLNFELKWGQNSAHLTINPAGLGVFHQCLLDHQLPIPPDKEHMYRTDS